MYSILEQLKDPKLDSLLGCLDEEGEGGDLTNKFEDIVYQYKEYDKDFLWILCYSCKCSMGVRKYIEHGYKKFKKDLDSNFLKNLVLKDGFSSRMWELVLCDMLRSLGTFVSKSEKGVDFLLKKNDGTSIQIEAVAPNESDHETHRAIRPDFSANKPFETLGNVEDLERPVLLRFLAGFDKKAKKSYNINLPLVIAINSHKAVGIVSNDDYVLRRILFGLGCETIIKKSDDHYKKGLQKKSTLNKPNEPPFDTARFLDEKYDHISGVLYTSQNPTELIPDGVGWDNSGVTFVSNPNATHPIDLEAGFFKKIICDSKKYEEIEATNDFKSNVFDN